MDENKLGTDVNQALVLLKEDIIMRNRQLDTLIKMKDNNTGLQTNRNIPMVNSVILNNNSISNVTDSIWNISNNGAILDPIVNKLMNNVEANLIKSMTKLLKNEKKNCDDEEISSIVNLQVLILKKELNIYEQKKCKEFNLLLEQSINENKKLSNQILKLRERWDSLVESAKQRKDRKQLEK